MRADPSAFHEAKTRLSEGRDALRHRLAAIRATNADFADLPEALEVTTQFELRKVDNALERLRSGKYGECAHCGYAIETPRLRALPQTECCAECA
jgi:RNA polymerase-binding transcription factor DksA